MFVFLMRTLDHVESPHEDDVVDKKVEGANVCTDLVGSGVGGSGIVVQIVIEVGICAACVCVKMWQLGGMEFVVMMKGNRYSMCLRTRVMV